MSERVKIFLIVLASIVIGGASFAYGAATAPRASKTPTPTVKPVPKASIHVKPTKEQLAQRLDVEYPQTLGILTAAYPKVTTDYTVDRGQLFDEGQWYGTTLRYHGADTLNRDTLRVLMQKKNGVWILRTTPPVLLLSTKQFPDVPKEILKTINQPVSLP